MTEYYPYPYSLDPLPSDLRYGLVALGVLGLMSAISTFSLLCWITYRFVSWRKYYRSYVGYNQYIVLIYNLLLADLIQAMSFVIAFHWYRLQKIVAPTPACFAQGFLIHLGDVASGLFVLSIAIHTWITVVRGRKITFNQLLAAIITCWVFALFVTVFGPANWGQRFFTRAGAWCWVSQDFEQERLTLHYLWIFIIEFGTIVIYASIFFFLRKQLGSIHSSNRTATSAKVSQAARYMVVYPLVYVLLTLPLAAGRMSSMSGHNLNNSFFLVAGSFMTSCGWMDSLMYTLTRQVLVKHNRHGGDSSTPRNQRGPTFGSDWGEITSHHHTSHSVTISAGGKPQQEHRNILTEMAMMSDKERGRAANSNRTKSRQNTNREVSPDGSEDTIMQPCVSPGEVMRKVEITVQTEQQEEPRTSSASSSSGTYVSKEVSPSRPPLPRGDSDKFHPV